MRQVLQRRGNSSAPDHSNMVSQPGTYPGSTSPSITRTGPIVPLTTGHFRRAKDANG